MQIKVFLENPEDQLFFSTIRMAKDLFEKYEVEDFALFISIVNKDNDDKACGKTFVVSGNELHIWVYLDNIRQTAKSLGGHGNFKKDVLHTILHEMHHALETLAAWSGSNLALEKIADDRNEALCQYYADNSGIDHYELWCREPGEVRAERFALRNLAYFWTVYNFKCAQFI